MDTKKRLLQCFENIGIIIELNPENDTSLLDLSFDSLMFVNLIIEIEHEFNIVFPDNQLNIDLLKSFNGFANLIDKLIEEGRENTCHEKTN